MGDLLVDGEVRVTLICPGGRAADRGWTAVDGPVNGRRYRNAGSTNRSTIRRSTAGSAAGSASSDITTRTIH